MVMPREMERPRDVDISCVCETKGRTEVTYSGPTFVVDEMVGECLTACLKKVVVCGAYREMSELVGGAREACCENCGGRWRRLGGAWWWHGVGLRGCGGL